ncbi:MAG: SUMF1/EgtB/PvdO family nonheme iron enzyme, partial [Verrucomicrobia bacterium]|nr:SUMF1/EgtB/PvdO family nonheme iron enzyme [Verrucomicrobiota bacterium]
PKCESGVFLRARRKELSTQILLTDDLNPPRPPGYNPHNRYTGSHCSVWPVVLDKKASLHPLGSWNQMLVEMRGSALRVRINGLDTLNRRLNQLPDAMGNLGLNRPRGRIGLMSCFGEVRFRNIYIKDLSAKPGDATPARQTPPATIPVLKQAASTSSTTGNHAQTGQPFVTSIGMELLYIPPGEFMLGSTKEERAWAAQPENGDEDLKKLTREGSQPRRATIRREFWLGRTEVTVGQWKGFVNATNYRTDAEQRGEVNVYDPKTKILARVKGLSWRQPGYSVQDNHPVTCIHRDDAVAFCDWLNQKEQTAKRLPAGYKIRLPTEAEWEYACRGGRQGTRFWWGDSKEDGKGRLNWQGAKDASVYVTRVDCFGVRGRNGFGLADMLGNVNEYCLDYYDPQGAHEDCYTASLGQHVLRGGAFNHRPASVRCATRHYGGSFPAFTNNGFRVCAGIDR